MVNIGNAEVSCGGLFENRLQQKGFQNFHFLLMKIGYFQVPLFPFWLLSHSCSEALGINKRVSLTIIKFWATIIFYTKIILFLMCFY